MKIFNRVLAILLAICFTISIAGCANNPSNSSNSETNKNSNNTSSIQDSTTDVPVPSMTPTVFEEFGLTEQQRNSFSMLYYLAITAEEIRVSKDNQLNLDSIYTSLLNDINPSAIDETTQEHLKNLRDIIASYRNIAVKRERLQYIYNQDKASTMRSAVPNPLAILSMTNSFNWKKLAISTVYTVVDSYSKYKSANETVDREFLLSGWELDDEEAEAVRKNRERAFDYMVDIVQEYELDGKLTLNEKAIENFVEICAIDSLQEKIRRLESEEKTYRLLGNYWLELADCYFENEEYEKCLKCAEMYTALSTGIYRKDFNYVKILPKVIVAAQETYSGDAYVSNVNKYADAIIENTETSDWSVRYFAAQVYLDLYNKANNQEYLEKAYNIAYDNVAILVDEQKELNATYLANVKEVVVEEPDYRFMTEAEKKEAEKEYKEEKKKAKNYNKSLIEARKTECPVVYEPLILNCDLLFALADKLKISDTEKTEIEAVLQTENNGIFIVEPINNRYSFSERKTSDKIEIKKDKAIIPVSLLSDKAKVTIIITDNGKTTTYDDCVIENVERKENKINAMSATITSDKMEDYTWSAKSKVTISINNGDEKDTVSVDFKVTEYSSNWIFSDTVVFDKA